MNDFEEELEALHKLLSEANYMLMVVADSASKLAVDTERALETFDEVDKITRDNRRMLFVMMSATLTMLAIQLISRTEK